MPIYVFKCEECEHKLEVEQKENFKFQKGFFNTVVAFFVAIAGAFMTAWFNWFHK